MGSRSNRRVTGPGLVGALVLAACGGSAQPPLDDGPDQDPSGAASPVPSGTVGSGGSEVPAGEGPVVSVEEPGAVDIAVPTSPPPYECPWERRGAMPEGRVDMAFAELGGQVYLFGGMSKAQYERGPADDATQSALNVYDPATDSWAERAAMPIDSGDVSAVTVGGFAYVFAGIGSGGSFIGRAYRYDAGANMWRERAPMRVKRTNFDTVAVGNKVYIIGGSEQGDDGLEATGWLAQAGIEIYDTVTDSWSAGALAPGAINNGSSCALGSRIYVFDGTVSGATYIYDTTTNSWSEGARAPQARQWASCVTQTDVILLMGGRTPLGYESDPAPTGPGDTSGTTIESSLAIQVYVPDTDSWSETRGMLRAREQFAAVPIGEDVYVIGGAESHTKEGPQGTVVIDEVTAMVSKFCEVR
jgi:N-acetylneuraminic acid mutarotase